jgi:hypothetical protein
MRDRKGQDALARQEAANREIITMLGSCRAIPMRRRTLRPGCRHGRTNSPHPAPDAWLGSGADLWATSPGA